MFETGTDLRKDREWSILKKDRYALFADIDRAAVTSERESELGMPHRRAMKVQG